MLESKNNKKLSSLSLLTGRTPISVSILASPQKTIASFQHIQLHFPHFSHPRVQHFPWVTDNPGTSRHSSRPAVTPVSHGDSVGAAQDKDRAVACGFILHVCVCSLKSFTLCVCVRVSVKIVLSTISLNYFTLLLWCCMCDLLCE